MGHRITLQLVDKPPPVPKGCLDGTGHAMAQAPSVGPKACLRCGMTEREVASQRNIEQLKANIRKAVDVQGTITMTAKRDLTTGQLVFSSEVKHQVNKALRLSIDCLTCGKPAGPTGICQACVDAMPTPTGHP